MNIAFVGHVDHGKSTLIGRLLHDTNSLPEGKIEEIEKTCKELGRKLEFAYICDALEEERKNQMTIETMQTFFRSKRREYAIIDAPGHKEFLKNMVTGASQADAAVLLVDAKEGVQEQTRRHAYLLKLLGIPRVIVTINKMDLVSYEKGEFDRVKKDMNSYLRRIGVEPICFVPISAYNGDNVARKSRRMKWYEGPTVIEALDRLKKGGEFFDFRFAVQDEYEVSGQRVFVGNILSGEVRRGETVQCYPNRRKIRIEKILVFEEELSAAKAPQAVGLVTDKKLERGRVLAKHSKPIVIEEISPLVFCLVGGVKKDENYTLRCVTQEVECRVEEISERIDVETLEKTKKVEELKETEIGRLKISLEEPIVVENFNTLKELGRFVILKEGRIIAGGIVV